MPNPTEGGDSQCLLPGPCPNPGHGHEGKVVVGTQEGMEDPHRGGGGQEDDRLGTHDGEDISKGGFGPTVLFVLPPQPWEEVVSSHTRTRTFDSQINDRKVHGQPPTHLGH